MENSHRSGNFCLLMSSMKDLTKSTGTKAACLFFLWASLKFLSTKTPARFDWPCPHTDLYTATLRETTDSANILTHTKPIDKVKKTVAWPLAEKRVFPQVLFTLKAIEQSLIYFVSSMFSALILVVFLVQTVLRQSLEYLQLLCEQAAVECMQLSVGSFLRGGNKTDTKFSHCSSNTLLIPYAVYEDSKSKATCLSSSTYI